MTVTATPIAMAPGRGSAWWVVGAFLGGLLTLIGAWGVAVGNADLGWSLAVVPAPHRVVETDPLTRGWIACFGACALGLSLLTAPGATGRRAAPSPIAGGVWTAGWTLLLGWFSDGFEFLDADSTCVYASCWPLHWQSLALASPLYAACLALIAVGTVLRRRPRWLRMLVPALTFLVLTVVQRLLWDGVILPFLAGPPPWWA